MHLPHRDGYTSDSVRSIRTLPGSVDATHDHFHHASLLPLPRLPLLQGQQGNVTCVHISDFGIRVSCQPAIPDLPEEPKFWTHSKSQEKEAFKCGFINSLEAFCLVLMGSGHVCVAHTVR